MKIRIPIPGLQRPIGAGTVIRAVTAKVGVRESEDCGCKKRAKKLNEAIEFRGWKEWQS